MADSGYFSLNNIEMPFSQEAEQAVLGCVLVEPSSLKNILIYITPEHFYLPQHKEIFAVMVALDATNVAIDPVVVLNMLVQQGSADRAAGKEYLFSLAQIVPSTANAETYAKIVREKYYVRTLINISSETIENAAAQEVSADELLNDAEQKIYNIRQGKVTSAPSKLSDIIVNEVYDRLHKLSGEDRDLYKGFTTGYNELDKVLTGLNKSDLILIGARPSMGKTSFALNIARNVSAIAKKKVLFFSLEMTKEQLAQRVLATEARVSSMKMRNGVIDNDEWVRLGKAAAVLNSCELYFDDSSNITVTEMKAKTRRLGNVDCVIIDYLGLIKPSGRVENRVQEISEITRNLKLMAKDLAIPIICCTQLSRSTEGRGKNHRPQLSDLRDSGSIEQDADIVMMLYRPDYYSGERSNDIDDDYNPGDENKVEVIIAKNRHGETGTANFVWDAEHTLFLAEEKLHNEM